MRSGRWTDGAVLVCTVALSRFAFRSRLLYDVDSVNFALALQRFDPRVHQPHPPGYYLYVCLGRLLQVFTHDANAALVWISILASCGAAVMIYRLADEWYGRRAAVSAGALFLLSPLGWFHGIVALTYMPEAFFSALVGYLCWRGFALPAAVALGVAAGFRPSSLLLLGPLWLLSLWGRPPRRIVSSFAALGLTAAAWSSAMLIECGGIRAWFEPLWSLWTLVPGRQSVFEAGVPLAVARLGTMAAMYALCFGGGALLAFTGGPEPASKRRRTFILVWMAPGLLFFTLVFLKYVNSGYLLVLTPPGFAWLGAKAAAWLRRPSFARWAVAAAAAVANVAFFLTAPVYCSYRSVRAFEAELGSVQARLARAFNPDDTLIVGFDSHFLGYRHAAYYLPEFLTVQYPAVPQAGGPGVFSAQHRQTAVLDEVPAGRFRTFVFFPLPEGDEYREYLAAVTRRFPNGSQAVRVDSNGFLTGPSAGLKCLFPVYGSAHVAANLSTRGDTPR